MLIDRAREILEEVRDEEQESFDNLPEGLQEGEIRDYKTACPELVLTCPGYFGGEGVGTICIPIKYCPECGRKLGKEENPGE